MNVLVCLFVSLTLNKCGGLTALFAQSAHFVPFCHFL